MAVTFTNKAAAELRERIRSELLKNNKPDEAQRILDGFVGTVNSVCARLLTEYAVDAKLSPALDVLPEEDSERLFQIAISSVIDEHANEIEPPAARLSLSGGGTGYQEHRDWQQDVREIVDHARANQLSGADLLDCARRSWESLRDLVGVPLTSDINQEMDKAVRRAIDLLEDIQQPLSGGTKKSLDELKKFSQQRERGINIWSEWVRLSKAKPNKDAVGLLDEVNIIAADVLRHPEFQSDVQRMIMGVFACAAEALQAYETFKEKQGLMDFVDQETKVLKLARENPAFRESMRDRLQQMMVDEFQDTSPIQLALFLKLHELAGHSCWVGDPKQTIYSFRGADPQLMDEVTRRITNTSTLGESWRSCETLVSFTNAVFSGVFYEMGKDKVCLNIPSARKEEAKGGWIESWHLPVRNQDDEVQALAVGIKDLLFRRDDIGPRDVAVLCRSNIECERVAASLEAMGIRAAAAQGSLLETRECQLAMAALKYMHDGRDLVALAEIVNLSPLHAEHSRWLETLILDKDDALAQWRRDPLIVALDQARHDLRHWTPLEALENAINKVDLVQTLNTWPNASVRKSNIDLLRGNCSEYLDQCRARRSAATVASFIAFLKDRLPGQAEGSGEQAVQVLTYHRCKGLEWPVVVLASLNAGPRINAFGIHVTAAPVFNPAEPLANRSIRYWPWPFGSQKKFQELTDNLAGREEELEAQQQERKDMHRLMYVGMTRARDGLVCAMRRKETQKETSLDTAWLDELTDAAGNPVLDWPLETGEQSLRIGEARIPIMVREFSPGDESGELDLLERANFLPDLTSDAIEYPAARISSSSIVATNGELKNIIVKKVADFGLRIEIKGNPDPTALGEAIHGFLGAELSEQSSARMDDIATGLLQCWGVEQSITVSDLMASRDRLLTFIEENYSGAKILREWPVTLRNEEHQTMHGWIDMLLELPDGYILIDHKSYSGVDAEDHALQYAPQLLAYKEAIEKAGDKKVAALLLHMPVSGFVYMLSQGA